MSKGLRLGAVTAVLAATAVTVSASSAGRLVNVPCTGSMLSGTFAAVPGSAGAGNIVYRLKVKDASTAACFVTGVPSLTLLDKNGGKLPTKGTFAGRPGMLTAVMIPLTPGTFAALTARFSPDVPGPGEPAAKGQCEKTAYKLRIAPSGGGTVTVPITPPTPVCEHGSMQLSTFTPA
jgi:hypothetical protein